jgi:undecaprenyl-diphosphatase
MIEAEQQPADPGYRLIAALVGLVGLWLAMLVFGAGAVDRALYGHLYSGGRPALVAIATAFTYLGEPTFLIAASAALAIFIWWRGHRRLALAVFAITMFGRALNELQKIWIGRVRPDLEVHLAVVKTMSFPSGHSTSATVFYLTAALVLTQGSRWRNVALGAAVVMAMCVGISRVMLGVHWPSDVIGGWSFGALWVLLTLRIADRWVAGLR